MKMTMPTPEAAVSGLAGIPPEVLARRLERQRAGGQATLLRELGPGDRSRVAAWCTQEDRYPELAALLTREG